ncbi:MAG: fibronectin type III domain-containing protein, partial [Acidobacteria bacterium]|nr:fibronectin type III domain-containing protein [Acidobacteriota bacterium]
MSLVRFSVTLAAMAAGLCMAGPAAGQTQPPEAPHVWSVDSLTEAVRVHWWAVTGADSYDVRWKGPGQPYDDNRIAEGIEAPEGVEPHYFYVIRELTNGTLYTVQVRASNSAGNSGWSNERTRRPTMPPDAPVLRATPGDRSIAVTWDAVPDAYYYQLAWTREGHGESDSTSVWSTSHTIENLEPGPYRLTGWTRNAEGNISESAKRVYVRVRDHIGPGAVALCGARVGTPTQLSRDAEVDVCWHAGPAIPPGTDVVLEARVRFFCDAEQPFRPWERVARGDSFTACPGGDGTCLQYTRVDWRGLAFEMELRIRRGNTVLGTSPVLKAHMPNSDTNELRSRLSGAIDEDTGRSIDVAEGPFVMQLEFTDPYVYLALPEIVLDLATTDFDVTNATVTGVENWGGDSGVYRVNVTPTTLGEPVTIGLPANRVKGVGEGISSSGGNNYTRDNTASNTVVQETAAPGSRGARSGVAALTAAFEDVPAAHRGSGSLDVRLRFSADLSTDYRTWQNEAVTVVGGRMLAVKRVNDRSDLWSITVSPESAGPVTLRVGSRGACDGVGAVCTADGRALSNRPSVTIQGPDSGPRPTGSGAGEAAGVVNRAPRAMGTIPPQVLGVDDAELTLDAARYFADEDEDGMTFAARSADPAVGAVSMAGPLLLVVTAVGPGTAAVMVTASDAAGLSAEQAFELRVADRWGHAATGDTLAALGRGYLSSVRATLGRRVESRASETEMTVAGQRIPLDRSTAREVGVSLVRRLFPQAGSPGGPSWVGRVSPGQAGFGGPALGSPVPGTSALGMPGSGLAGSGARRVLPAGSSSTIGPGHPAVGSPGGLGGLGLFGGGASRVLRRTSVALPLGGVSAGQASDGTAPASPGRRWTVWG